MAKFSITLDADVRAVLERSHIARGMVVLPPGQLDRTLYDRVNKVLMAAGGKWDRRAKAHLFTCGRDPREALGLALSSGAIVDQKKALQQFFTPDALANDLCGRIDVTKGDFVLEPSAGGGSIA